MSSVNLYRDTGPEDYLAKSEKDRRASKLGNTAQRNYTPLGLLPADSQVTVTTEAGIDEDTLEATTAATVATEATLTGFTAGAFTVSLKDDGSDQSQPLFVDFGDVG